MYSRDEVEGMLEHLNVVTKDNMRQEVQNILSMNVLLIKQVLERASQQRAEVKLDMGAIEDQAMLDAVDKIRLDQARAATTRRPGRSERGGEGSPFDSLVFSGRGRFVHGARSRGKSPTPSPRGATVRCRR